MSAETAPNKTFGTVAGRPPVRAYSIPAWCAHLSEQLQPMLTEAFISQPLLGNIRVTPDQTKSLHAMAQNILFDALRGTDPNDYVLSKFDCDILVLATVLLLRDWKGDETDDRGFWQYIYNQYTLQDDGGFGQTYSLFRKAIESTLRTHERLFVKTGKRYYTSMLAHALAPKNKFYSLFEQIFAFYAKTLKYQYSENDRAFEYFAEAMKRRFESRHYQKADDVYIKSMESSSAIKALFLYDSEYMRTLVGKIVRTLDILAETWDAPKADYIDELLVDWYRTRTPGEHSSTRNARAAAGKERPITEYTHIRLFYRYAGEQVELIVPPIRFKPEPDGSPKIRIYRSSDDSSPYLIDLSYYGDSVCITSNRTSIPLDELITENVAEIGLRAVISNGTEDVWDSGSQLHRNAITFGADGNELTRRPNDERVNVFVLNDVVVEGKNTSRECVAKSCGVGRVFRILFEDQTHLVVNGFSLFPIELKGSGLDLYISASPVKHCKYLIGQRECEIFTKQIELLAKFTDLALARQYRLVIDGSFYPFTDRNDEPKVAHRIILPDNPEKIHEIEIIENISHKRVYLRRYVVIPDFVLDYSGFYYHEAFDENGVLTVSGSGNTHEHFYETLPGQNVMSVKYGAGELIVDVPRLECRLDGEVLLGEMQRIIWCDDVPMYALLEVDAPRGHSATVYIGDRPFPSGKIEIGNELKTMATPDSGNVTVNLEVDCENANGTKIKLFEIAFRPFFKMCPIFADNTDFYWAVEDNFIGHKNTEFRVEIDSPQNNMHIVGCEDRIVKFDKPLENGVYKYTISANSSGPFSCFTELCTGNLILGKPPPFDPCDTALVVTEAIDENERIKLEPASGIIVGLEYVGEKSLNGETQPYPCYTGCIQYRDSRSKLWKPYSYRDREAAGVEQINPVKVWIISDEVISLRGPYDDGLYVHKEWLSITDRTPKPWYKKPYCTPLYYHFYKRPSSEVKNV